MRKVINATLKSGVRRFYKELFTWIGPEVIGREVRYFRNLGEMTNYLMRIKKFGNYYYDESRSDYYYELEDESEEAAIKRNAEDLKEWATDTDVVKWRGRGYYVSWSWELEHIERIDKAYISLIDEYHEKQDQWYFPEPTNEDLDKLMEEMDIQLVTCQTRTA